MISIGTKMQAGNLFFDLKCFLMSDNMCLILFIVGIIMSYWTFLLSYKDLFGQKFLHPFEPVMGMLRCVVMSWAAMATLFIAWIVVKTIRIFKE